MSTATASPVDVPVVFRGNNYRIVCDCTAPAVVLAGPAGTGKTTACLFKLHACCLLRPRLRCLIVRKTRESLTESVVVTYERDIVPGWVGSVFTAVQRSNRHSYLYPNGSEIVLGGMDRPSKIMSSEWDLIFAGECVEFLEEDWDALSSRLRSNRMAYQQLIGDTNPDRPTHWIRQRAAENRLLLLETRHEDNPTLWDGRTWTPNGLKYVARLDALTGPRKQRLRYGRWVQAEGVILDMWDRNIHLIDPFPIPKDWPRYMAIDFGYRDPMVIQWWAVDGDGRLYLYRELIHPLKLVSDMASQAKRFIVADGVAPSQIICDHDAEDRATVESVLGMRTRPANKDIASSIQALGNRLTPQGDGKPRLHVLSNAVVARDPEMVERHAPIGFADEVDGWCWQDTIRREVPVDGNDHSIDCARYLVGTLDGPQRKVTFRVV